MLAYAADIRRAANADGSFVVLFTKYPAPHGAYASGSWKRMVIRKDDLSSDMDRVIAHETGHIFGAPDEYGSSGCSCTSEHGRFFQEVNGNCVNCTDALRSDSGYPQSVGGSWGHAAPFSSDLDAALMHDNGKVYFFKGNQYVRFTNVGEGVDSGYPRSIAGNWPGVPVSFQSDLDSALMRDNGRIYLFKRLHPPVERGGVRDDRQHDGDVQCCSTSRIGRTVASRKKPTMENRVRTESSFPLYLEGVNG